MTFDPYTHVQLLFRPDRTARLTASFYTPRLRIECLTTSDERPFLTLATAEADVLISTSGGGPVTGADLVLARTLHEATGRYLAECERLHAERIAAAAGGDPAQQAGPISTGGPVCQGAA